MKYLLLSCFFVYFLLNNNFILAQSKEGKGTLRVYTKPKDAVIKMGGEKLEYGKSMLLDTGKYVIKAWAPKRELVEKEILLKEKQYKTVPIKLPYNAAYKKYKWKHRYYVFKKATLKYGFLTVYSIFAISNYLQIQQLEDDANQYKRNTENYKQAYETSFWPVDIENNKARYYSNKAEYNSAVDEMNQKMTRILYGAGATACITYFTWRWGNKLKKPIYEEVPQLSRLQINPFYTPLVSGFQLNYQF